MVVREKALNSFIRVSECPGGSVSWKVRRARYSSSVWSSIRMPWAELNRLGCLFISAMSAWRVMDQKDCPAG